MAVAAAGPSRLPGGSGDGRSRFKNVFGAELDRAVDELLAEQRAAEAAKKR